jgi:hypothetical protein
MAILLWVIGIPLPPKLFYSLFSKNSHWLPFVYRSGIFGFDSRHVCEDWMGWSSFSFDRDYYEKLQTHMNLTDEKMFDYLQQWMCVVPPDNEEGYRKVLQSFSMDYMPYRDYADDSGSSDISMESNFGADNRWMMDSVYQEVESEPLNF